MSRAPKVWKLSGTTYTTVRKLGTGSFSNVYLVKIASSTSDTSQLRVLKESLSTISDKYIISECKILRKIEAELKESVDNTNEYFIRLHSCENDDKIILMEYLEDYADCFDLLYDTKTNFYDRLCFSDIYNFSRSLLQAVQVLHAKEIAHRDLKPENILFNYKLGKLKVFDFGLSCARENCELKFVGSRDYCAPEIFSCYYNGNINNNNDDKDAIFTKLKQIDMWALGQILYEFLAHLHYLYIPNLINCDEKDKSSLTFLNIEKFWKEEFQNKKINLNGSIQFIPQLEKSERILLIKQKYPIQYAALTNAITQLLEYLPENRKFSILPPF